MWSSQSLRMFICSSTALSVRCGAAESVDEPSIIRGASSQAETMIGVRGCTMPPLTLSGNVLTMSRPDAGMSWRRHIRRPLATHRAYLGHLHAHALSAARSGMASMTALNIEQVNLPGVAITGLISGYVMALVGLWAGRMPGLVAVDIADFGRRYIVSDRPSAWMIGFASHLVNSVLLTLVWASVIVPNLHWPRPVAGAAFGLVLSLTLAGLLVAPMSGLGVLGARTGSASFAITGVLVHLVWGVLIGLLYVPA